MRCRIRIKGHLDHSWQEWLEGLELVHDVTGTTVLRGTLRDQAALYGVLLKIRRLNMRLLSLETIEALQDEFPFYWTVNCLPVKRGGSSHLRSLESPRHSCGG